MSILKRAKKVAMAEVESRIDPLITVNKRLKELEKQVDEAKLACADMLILWQSSLYKAYQIEQDAKKASRHLKKGVLKQAVNIRELANMAKAKLDESVKFYRQLEGAYYELSYRRDALVMREKIAQASLGVEKAQGFSAKEELAELENDVRQQEVKAAAYKEIRESSYDYQFEKLMLEATEEEDIEA